MAGKSHGFAEDWDCLVKENVKAKSLQSVLVGEGVKDVGTRMARRKQITRAG